jgi:Ser/Thr protein kinase RdoA (MazF antagonist)
MPPLADQNPQQQRAFWQAQAKRACQHFQWQNYQLTWLGYTHNAVFRIDTDEKTFVLRLVPYSSAIHAYTQIQAQWLSQLPPHIHIQRPAFADIQNALLRFQHDDGDILASLWQYVAGEILQPQDLTPAMMRNIAELLANLHRIPTSNHEHLPSLMMEGLFGQAGRYTISDDTFARDDNAVIQQALTYIQQVMDKLTNQHQPHTPQQGILHGDLLTKNIVLMDDDQVGAIDVEYVGWGLYLYDLTPLMWQLKALPNTSHLLDAYWQAYHTLMPHVGTRQDLEVLVVARHIASLHWVTLNRHHPSIGANYDAIITQRISELREFLQTGILQRHA